MSALLPPRTDEQLFTRLVPKIKGRRAFNDIQKRRLGRLGIEKSEADTFTSEELGRYA